MKTKFLSQVIEFVPRLLTQLDRDPLSPTYGCFDRNYWHYKIRDFSSMVLQQNVWTMALIYHNNFDKNIYYKSPILLEYINAALNFWIKAQHNDGSFDEYWPNECGYPPLVFSTHAVLRTIMLLNLDKKKYHPYLKKSIKQIIKYHEKKALNQEAAGVLCLYYYSELFDEETFVRKSFEEKLDKLLSYQSIEGWFPEYGGADIGYSSVFLNYLSELIDTEYKEVVVQPLNKQLLFLKHFVHPDGTVGGEYGSRNTEYFLLAGLVRMHKHSDSAKYMLSKINWSLSNLDDRYLFHYIFHSFVEGSLRVPSTINNYEKPTKNAEFEHYFLESGIYINYFKQVYFVANMKKGGVFKLYTNNRLQEKCGGYRFPLKKGVAVTNWLDHNAEVFKKNSKISCINKMHVNKFNSISPIKHILLRIVAVAPFKKQIINFLKQKLIHSSKNFNLRFIREFLFYDDRLVIIDKFSNTKTIKIQRFAEASMRYVPSSKFFDSGTMNIKKIKSLATIQPNSTIKWTIDYE